MKELLSWFLSIFNATGEFAEAEIHNVRIGLMQIFYGSLGLSLVLVLLGFGIHVEWLIITGSMISFITLIISLFYFMGVTWAGLLIAPQTNEKTQAFIHRFILPVITWVSVVNMLFLILPTQNWGIKEPIVLIFTVIVAVLSRMILNEKAQFIYKTAFSVAAIIIGVLFLEMLFPTAVSNLNDGLISPTNQAVDYLTQTWYGTLFFIVIVIFVVNIAISIIKKMNGDKVDVAPGVKSAVSKTSTVIGASLMNFFKLITMTIIVVAGVAIFLVLLHNAGWSWPGRVALKTANDVIEYVKEPTQEASSWLGDFFQSEEKPTTSNPPTVQQSKVQPQPTSPKSKLPQVWQNASFKKQNGSININVTKASGITLSAGTYYFEIPNNQTIEWSYDNSGKNWTTIQNGTELQFTSTAMVYAHAEDVILRVRYR